MQSVQRPSVPTFFALLLGFGLMQMGNTLQGTLLSIRGGIERFSLTQIGAVGAGFWVDIVIGSLCCGKVVQAVGHILAFLALGAIASTAPLLHLLIVDPIAWVVARALTGFCFAGLFIVVESWLNGAVTEETRGANHEHLRHDGAVGRDPRTAPSSGDRSGRFQTVLPRGDYSRAGYCTSAAPFSVGRSCRLTAS